MKCTFKLLAVSLLFSAGIKAQRTCGTPVPPAEWDAWFNQKVLEHKQNLAAGKTKSTNFTIPVIVHVIHGGQNIGTYPNITQAQINSQIKVLNDDFAGVGFNVNNLASTGFASVGAADCSISFCLAQLDPSDNPLPEWGIDRVNYLANTWTNPASFNSTGTFQNYIDGVVKPATIWDPVRYFNIWVTDHGNGVDLLGYATFPAGSGLTGISSTGNTSTDGIWVWSKAFGDVGTLVGQYNKGRTASHEAGHWLGLRHIGGDASPPSCSSTDFCNDTPPQKGGFQGGQFGQNFGSPTYPLYATGTNACPAAPFGNMFMNFMDYVDDAYCYMFTPDQSARMTTAMTNGTLRNQLTASSATLCDVFQSASPVSNFVIPTSACTNTPITPNNQTTGTPAPTFVWSVVPSGSGMITPNTSTMTPNITFANAGTYTINLTATNSAGTNLSSQAVVVTVCTAGIQANSMLQNTIQFAPNPTSGIVNITSSSNENQNLEITVHNYLGQFVTSAIFKDVSTNGASFDMSAYSSGVYFVTIDNGHSKAVKPLILNK